MSAGKKNPAGLQVDRGLVKAGIKERTDCSALENSKAAQNPICQIMPSRAQASTELSDAATYLYAADNAYLNALQSVETTRGARDTKIVKWNNLFEVYASQVEKHSIKPEDFTALAVSVLERH